MIAWLRAVVTVTSHVIQKLLILICIEYCIETSEVCSDDYKHIGMYVLATLYIMTVLLENGYLTVFMYEY